tara:strand:+ start:543 stop:1730 length:1188 start_codon:yes stop_codon:yes gene_type:complete
LILEVFLYRIINVYKKIQGRVYISMTLISFKKGGYMIYILLILLVIILGVTIFVNTSPEFGASKILMNKDKINKLDNYNNEKFSVDESTDGNITLSTFIKFFMPKNTEPGKELPIVKLDKNYFDKTISQTRLTWFGHSTVMLEIDKKKLLIDPVLSDYASPVKGYFVKPRYQPGLPLQAEDLPNIDAVLISHDHYDHLDYETIIKLKDKVSNFFVPLGVGSHLLEWGVDKSKIIELNWWEDVKFEELTLSFAPTRHFSGRGLTNKNSTLWGSWVIAGTEHNLYFSGDSGYSKYFKQIGDKYGPFDLTMVECGQYNEDWHSIHMTPEESVQANIDLQGDVMIPIHWSAFTLSLHTWNEPVKRAAKHAEKLKVNMLTPKIGQSIIIGEDNQTTDWWK